jgi:hypothetical protein
VHNQLSAEEKYILSGSKGVAIWAESSCYSGAWSWFKSAVFCCTMKKRLCLQPNGRSNPQKRLKSPMKHEYQ